MERQHGFQSRDLAPHLLKHNTLNRQHVSVWGKAASKAKQESAWLSPPACLKHIYQYGTSTTASYQRAY